MNVYRSLDGNLCNRQNGFFVATFSFDWAEESIAVRTIEIQTKRRTQMINITTRIQQEIRESGLAEGLCCVYVPHTTAGVFINEGADPSVMEDVEDTFDRLVPWTGPYRHTEGNAAAHVKSTLVGESVTVLVQNGALRLGTWQAIFFAEFDGPRRRTVWIGTVPAA